MNGARVHLVQWLLLLTSLFGGPAWVSGAAISKIKDGINPLTLQTGLLIADRLDVDIEWLMAFDYLREMFPSATDEDFRRAHSIHRGRTLGWAISKIANASRRRAEFPDCQFDLRPRSSAAR